MTGYEVKVKICGLTRPADCEAVNNAQADYAGFVFAPSRRQVDAGLAADLALLLNPGISTVGVFVNEDDEKIVQIATLVRLAVVQLQGDAWPGRITRLRSILPPGTAIWQRLAVPLDRPVSEALPAILKTLNDYSSAGTAPDAWLLDSCKSGQAGGTGETFDWSLFRNLHFPAPLVLAGGLTPANVGSAVQLFAPAVVDTSSGVETGSVKDPGKIIRFCISARSKTEENKP